MCKQRHMLHLLSVSKAGNRAECQVGPTPFNVYYPGSEHTLPIRSKLCSCLSFIQKAWLMEDLGVLKGVQTSMRLKPERFLKYFCRHVHVRVSSYYIYNYRSFCSSFKEGVTLYSRRHKLCLWWMRLKSNFSQWYPAHAQVMKHDWQGTTVYTAHSVLDTSGSHVEQS